MLSVLIQYSVEAIFMALIIFGSVRRSMVKGKGWKPDRWDFIGGVMTAFGSGISRFMIGRLFGYPVMLELWSNDGVGLIGPTLVPLLWAVATVAVLRTDIRAHQQREANRGSKQPS